MPFGSIAMAADNIQEVTETAKLMNLQEKVHTVNTEDKWGFELPQLYQLAIKFYREKEGKAIQLTYGERLRFAALAQQVAHGPCRSDALPQLGVLDVIGRDRRQAWLELGETDRPAAMVCYVELLDSVCPIFRPYAEAHKRDLEAKRRKREEEREAEELRQGRLLLEEMARRQREEELLRQAETKRRIQDALNQQTYVQFRAYAEQQYPSNPEQQAVLIRQLQEQHYQQYMQQLYHRLQQQGGAEDSARSAGGPTESAGSAKRQVAGAAAETSSAQFSEAAAAPDTRQPAPAEPAQEAADGDGGGGWRLRVARMWTRRDLAPFKAAVRAEGGRAVITVGHGETVTVRVPTHDDGACLFWEFATDSHDLGFGLFFEWGASDDQRVTIQVSDSEEDEEEQEESDSEPAQQSEVAARPAVSCIVPVYRRDCHQEVYAGSHQYPAQGVYLLKFDNSYSMWRSKTLYYRVYYTQ